LLVRLETAAATAQLKPATPPAHPEVQQGTPPQAVLLHVGASIGQSLFVPHVGVQTCAFWSYASGVAKLTGLAQ
jgi:hypothetical protein